MVEPYVAAHAAGRTPNPCIECNRHLKFDRLLERADVLGFDAVATGHHARVVERPDGTRRVARGADGPKDQSYVLHMLDQAALARVLLPVGDLTKAEVRERAADLGLRTADKPDSQDVCFIQATAGRRGFLESRIDLTPGRVVDDTGRQVGEVEAVELVTVGQRRGLGLRKQQAPSFVTSVDVTTATVTVGRKEDLLDREVALVDLVWADAPVSGPVLVQCSAHGEPRPGTLAGDRLVVGGRPSHGSPPARASCSTTATRSSAAPSPADPGSRHRHRRRDGGVGSRCGSSGALKRNCVTCGRTTTGTNALSTVCRMGRLLA